MVETETLGIFGLDIQIIKNKNENEKSKYELLQNVAARTNQRERKLVNGERRRNVFFSLGKKWKK